MKQFVAILLLSFAVLAVQNGNVKPLPPVVLPRAETRLTWENHRLRAANLQMQIGVLQRQLDDENKAADAVFKEMQDAAGDKYVPQLNPQTNLLEFVLKPEPPKPEKKP